MGVGQFRHFSGLKHDFAAMIPDPLPDDLWVMYLTGALEIDEKEEQIDEAVNRFFVLPIFVLLGLSLPWGEWINLGWKGPVLAIFILLLRRPPWVVALAGRVPRVQGTQDRLFTGWFGPIGVAALYYATLAEHTVGLEEAWVVGSLVISVSALAHGRLYEDMLSEIEKAENYIFVETFMWLDDEVGRRFVEMLARKAREGVRVYAIFDELANLGQPESFKNFPDGIHTLRFRSFSGPTEALNPRSLHRTPPKPHR